MRKFFRLSIAAMAVTVGIALNAEFNIAMAQQSPVVKGDFAGTLGPLQLKLHVVAAKDGKLSATLDSPNQGALGIPCTDVMVEGKTLSFNVPSVRGSWTGTIEEGGEKLSGTWSQGTPMPLVLTRDKPDTFVAAKKPSPVDGFWLGTLQAPAQSLRIQIAVKSDRSGKEFCTFDSLDQRVVAIPCSNVVYSGSDFSFEIPAVRGDWQGKLSSDGKSLEGTWTQGMALPLNFARQTKPETLPAKGP